LERSEISVCLHDPGFDVDVLVTTDIAAFHRVWLGRLSLSEAIRNDLVRLEGTQSLTSAVGGWFGWSPFAETVRAGRAV
jgi:hypothetical protein